MNERARNLCLREKEPTAVLKGQHRKLNLAKYENVKWMAVSLLGRSSVCVPVRAVVVCPDDTVIVATPYPKMEVLTVKEMKSKVSHVRHKRVRFTEGTVSGVRMVRAQPPVVLERNHAYEPVPTLHQLTEDASATTWVMLKTKFIAISDPVLLMANTPTGGSSPDVQSHAELDNRHACVSARTPVPSLVAIDAWEPL